MFTREKIEMLDNYLWKMRRTLADEEMLRDDKNVEFNRLYDRVEVLRLNDASYANVIEDVYLYCMNTY